MAGAMRKMGIYLGLVEEDERALEEEEYAEQRGSYPANRAHSERGAERTLVAERAPERSFDRPAPRPEPAADADGFGESRRRSTERPRTWAAAAPAETYPTTRGALAVDDAPYRITTLHPRTYNEARTIGEHFRDGVPVIMNLTEMDDADAKRLVDFAAGLSFGLRGSIERVTNKVFLLSPQNVSVTAEEKARIVEGGFFNQS